MLGSSSPESSTLSTTSDDELIPFGPEDDTWDDTEGLDSDSDIQSNEVESDDSGFVTDDKEWILNDNEEKIRWSEEG